jgi:hypothetical protein
VTGGGKAGHVGADLGDDRLRGGAANAGDLIQPLDRRPPEPDRDPDVGLGCQLAPCPCLVVNGRGRGHCPQAIRAPVRRFDATQAVTECGCESLEM